MLSAWIMTGSNPYGRQLDALWGSLASGLAPQAVLEQNLFILMPLWLLAWTPPQLILAMISGRAMQLLHPRIVAQPVRRDDHAN